MADPNNSNGNPNPGTSCRGNLRIQNIPADQQQQVTVDLGQHILNNTNVMLKHEIIKIP